MTLYTGSATTSGTSNLEGWMGISYISTGWLSGTSTLEWDWIREGSATIDGTSTVTADGIRVRTAKAVSVGSSQFLDGSPPVLSGTSLMTEMAQVSTHVVATGLRTFIWMQLFQRGNLAVQFCDGENPVIPYDVYYRLTFIRPDGSRMRVGPRKKIPARGGAGEYYVTGLAGEHGQPGEWLVQWFYKHYPTSSIKTVEMSFQILDAVLCGCSYDLTDRQTVYGWL